MYKLIATDIDGTLINSKRILTDNTKKVLKEASENGLTVMLCSGSTSNFGSYYRPT